MNVTLSQKKNVYFNVLTPKYICKYAMVFYGKIVVTLQSVRAACSRHIVSAVLKIVVRISSHSVKTLESNFVNKYNKLTFVVHVVAEHSLTGLV